MAIERILVGDDQIDFAKKNFPYVPGVDVDFVSDPRELVERARTGQYDTVITDLNYTETGTEGFRVLEALATEDVRKILWTGNSDDPHVREKATALGAEVLGKNELGTLVGQAVSRAPIKEDGDVLVYVNSRTGPFLKTMQKMMGMFFKPERVRVGSDLKAELRTGQYGLVIDTSTIPGISGGEARAHGTVAHDMKYIELSEVPRVVTVHGIELPPILQIVASYLGRQ